MYGHFLICCAAALLCYALILNFDQYHCCAMLLSLKR
uniref:Uncharacterized protein n=1 Tax=Rhizophora mucronata TaxID=61149 RepID=A0A2P2Q0F6_RHIMU